MNTEGILARLRGVKRSKDGYTALCPSHDDQGNSLSIKPTTHRILLNCFAGCPIEQICIHLGIEMKDLFFSNGTAAPKIVTTYHYTDEKGALLYQVVRTEPKGFFQRHRGPIP
jgi:putative DNA primase/helicase